MHPKGIGVSINITNLTLTLKCINFTANSSNFLRGVKAEAICRVRCTPPGKRPWRIEQDSKQEVAQPPGQAGAKGILKENSFGKREYFCSNNYKTCIKSSCYYRKRQEI
jgi:hypothetical protein